MYDRNDTELFILDRIYLGVNCFILSSLNYFTKNVEIKNSLNSVLHKIYSRSPSTPQTNYVAQKKSLCILPLYTKIKKSEKKEKVLVEILTNICRSKKLQSWEGFYEYCKDYANKKQKKIPMLSQTLH